MYNKAHLYDVSFVSPKGSQKAQFVFTFEQRHMGELTRRLQILAQRTDSQAYLGGQTEFQLPVSDLFGHISFGFGSCGFASSQGEKVQLHIELAPGFLSGAVLTIHLVSRALLSPFEEVKVLPNQPQQLDLETVCEGSAVYGHAMGGYVSGSVLAWLRSIGSLIPEDQEYAPVPERVTLAMRQAWSAVNPGSKIKRIAEDFRGMVGRDGRFILQCPGNACDIAIYPDSIIQGHEDYGVRFSCHNLDRADQQVALLAGLAKLCELARTSE